MSEVILDCFSILLTETRPLNQAQSSLMWLVSPVILLWETIVSFEGWNYSPPTPLYPRQHTHLTHGFWGSKTKSSS